MVTKVHADSPRERATAERLDETRAARRRNAAAYLAWDASADREDLDELDRATAAMSQDGAEW